MNGHSAPSATPRQRASGGLVADLQEIIPGVDPGGVAVAPLHLHRVAAHLVHPLRLHAVLHLRLADDAAAAPLLDALRAGAACAEPLGREPGFAPVVPADEQVAVGVERQVGRFRLRLSRLQVIEESHASVLAHLVCSGDARARGVLRSSRLALRDAHPPSRLGGALREDGGAPSASRAAHAGRRLRPGQLDGAAAGDRDRRRSRAADAPPRPQARAGAAAGRARRFRPAHPLGRGGRRHLPQRPLSAAGSGRRAAGGTARAAARRARRPAGAAGGPPRGGPRPRARPALATLGAHRGAVAHDERGVRAPHRAVALGAARVRRAARSRHRGDAGRSRAAGGGGEGVRLLHFSDPHVQLPRWRERSVRELGALRALATVELWKGRGRDYDGALATLRQIVRDADALRADLVVCTGDLTQLAMEEEFALAREALAPLGERLLCIPGNHDRYPLEGAPNRLFETYFPPRPLPHPFVALDSCGEVCWPVITQGRVRHAELQQDFRGKVVLVHHAPFRRGGIPDWPWHRLRGARALLEATRDSAAVLCGHIHDRFRSGNVICCGSSTKRGDEGYWILDLGAVKALDLTRYAPGARAVSPTSRHTAA